MSIGDRSLVSLSLSCEENEACMLIKYHSGVFGEFCVTTAGELEID